MSAGEFVRIGDDAQAATPLRPGGTVVVRGQRYSARTRGPLIEAGTELVIIGGDIYGLLVDAAICVSDRTTLPDFGRSVISSFGASVRRDAVDREMRLTAWRAARRRWVRRAGPVLGGLVAFAGSIVAWPSLLTGLGPIQAGLVGAVLVPVGMAVGLSLLEFVDRALQNVDLGLHRFSLVTVTLLLTGFAIGATLAIPRFGVTAGVVVAVGTALLVGLPLPVLAIAVAVGGESAEGNAEAGGIGAGDASTE